MCVNEKTFEHSRKVAYKDSDNTIATTGFHLIVTVPRGGRVLYFSLTRLAVSSKNVTSHTCPLIGKSCMFIAIVNR